MHPAKQKVLKKYEIYAGAWILENDKSNPQIVRKKFIDKKKDISLNTAANLITDRNAKVRFLSHQNNHS